MEDKNATKTVLFSARIPVDLHKKIKILCIEQDMSVQQFVYQALQEKYQKESKKKPS